MKISSGPFKKRDGEGVVEKAFESREKVLTLLFGPKVEEELNFESKASVLLGI